MNSYHQTTNAAPRTKYVHQEYPKVMFHPSGKTAVSTSAEDEQNARDHGWCDVPFAKPAPADPAQQAQALAARVAELEADRDALKAHNEKLKAHNESLILTLNQQVPNWLTKDEAALPEAPAAEKPQAPPEAPAAEKPQPGKPRK